MVTEQASAFENFIAIFELLYPPFHVGHLCRTVKKQKGNVKNYKLHAHREM
jgi:hypothetical protein